MVQVVTVSLVSVGLPGLFVLDTKLGVVLVIVGLLRCLICLKGFGLLLFGLVVLLWIWFGLWFVLYD